MKKKIQKPFDAEAAKRGAKIETRNGKSVRIVCYDKKGVYSIIALIDYGEVENYSAYTIKGGLIPNETSEEDLVIVEEVEYPKFKEGEWLFRNVNGACPCLITTVTSNWYEVEDTQGHKDTIGQITADNHFRLWTIDDAKPGDILVCEDDGRPFIFKESFGGVPTAYCGIDTTNSIFIDINGPWTRGSVRPATKEQRNTLFKKMEEEGYKWDAETLTLSKIQKRWRDDENTEINGYYINDVSRIVFHSGKNACMNYNIFSNEKQAKSALAMARISQIMANDERFGGVVTDKEGCDNHWRYAIIRTKIGLELSLRYYGYEYLAFHTREQAELFLKENEDLVKDYYMID